MWVPMKERKGYRDLLKLDLQVTESRSVWVLRTEPGSSSLQTGLLNICLSFGEHARWVFVSSLASNGQ